MESVGESVGGTSTSKEGGKHHKGNRQGLTYISADEWASHECQQEEIAIGCSDFHDENVN
jgi:hypothetical protein